MALLSWNQLNLPSNFKADLSNVASSFNPNAASRGYSAPTTSATGLSSAGNFPTLAQTIASRGISIPQLNLNKQGNVTSVPPAPTTQTPSGAYVRQGETLAKEFTNYNVPDHPPLTNSDGSDTEFGQLVKMGGGSNPSQNQRYLQLLSEWKTAHPPPPAPVPSPTLPPTPTAQAPVKPVGGTAALPSVGPTGTAGSTVSPALTQAGMATKGLQRPGLDLGVTPQSPSAQMIPQLPTGQPSGITPEFIQRLQGGLEAKTPQAQQTRGYFPEKDTGGAIDPVRRLSGQIQSGLGLNEAQQVHPIQNFIETMQRGASEASGAFSQQQKSFLTPTGQAIPKGPDQTGKTLAPGINDTKGINKSIQQVINGKGNMQDIAANIASEAAIPEINKAMYGAQQSGDMQTVSKLADLAIAVQQNIKFQNQINQVIKAISMGFGAPNLPGVTEARMPSVQQGVFGALESPQAPTLPQGIGTDAAQFLSPRLQDVSPTQQNKPVFPFIPK